MPTLILWIAIALALVAMPLQATGQGPLQAYVSKPDASFSWTRRHEGTIQKSSYVELILTSQTWRQVVWKHQLFIIKPANLDPKTRHALLFISGGRWRDEFERPGGTAKLPSEAEQFANLAELLQAPVAVLRQVPQQPMFDGKTEDDIIAFTFDEYLRTQDAEWPLLLPMVKSAVRAMDAVQAYTGQAWSLDIEHFTVTGASKRGWTTWLSATADDRVAAIAPMVIDMLNLEPQLKHQLSSWGAISHKLEDYTERHLHHKLMTPAGRRLRAIVDPYHYRAALPLPKLLLLGTNDQYWPLDALNLYWNDLIGEKYILYLPNNGHSLEDYPRIIGTLNALHQHVARGYPLPRLDWTFSQNDGHLLLHMASDISPQQVNAWVATAETRDFRHARWQSFPLQADSDTFVYSLEIPRSGYVALFGEAFFDNGAIPYAFSTTVTIVSAPSTQGGPERGSASAVR